MITKMIFGTKKNQKHNKGGCWLALVMPSISYKLSTNRVKMYFTPKVTLCNYFKTLIF